MGYSVSTAATLLPRRKQVVDDASQLLALSTSNNVTMLSAVRASRASRNAKEVEENQVVAEISKSLASKIIGSQLQALAVDKAKEQEQKGLLDQELEERGPSAANKVIKSALKIARFLGRTIIRYVVKPIFRFVTRVAMNLARFVCRSVVTYLVEPMLAAIASFVVANPVTAAAGIALLAAGGAYFIYDKLMKRKDVPESAVPTPNTVDSDFAAEAAQQRPTAAAIFPSTVPSTMVPTYVPPVPTVAGAQGFITPSRAAQPTGKFKGFGAQVDSAIKETASIFGIPEDVLRGFIKMEGGWAGQMSPTGAIGPGQFIMSTWNELIDEYDGAGLGMTRVTRSNFRTNQDPRWNTRINILATGLLASINAKKLKDNGLPASGENLYMMHNIGPGIIPVMKGKAASPETLRAMQLNGMMYLQTPQQFLAMQQAKFRKHYEIANTGTAVKENMIDASGGKAIDKKVAIASTAIQTTSPTGNPTNTSSSVPEIVRLKNNSLMEIH